MQIDLGRHVLEILHVVNLGDDTYTTGCVAGGLAGITHGESAIPAAWVEGLVKREGLVALAEEFVGVCAPTAMRETPPKSG